MLIRLDNQTIEDNGEYFITFYGDFGPDTTKEQKEKFSATIITQVLELLNEEEIDAFASLRLFEIKDPETIVWINQLIDNSGLDVDPYADIEPDVLDNFGDDRLNASGFIKEIVAINAPTAGHISSFSNPRFISTTSTDSGPENLQIIADRLSELRIVGNATNEEPITVTTPATPPQTNNQTTFEGIVFTQAVTEKQNKRKQEEDAAETTPSTLPLAKCSDKQNSKTKEQAETATAEMSLQPEMVVRQHRSTINTLLNADDQSPTAKAWDISNSMTHFSWFSRPRGGGRQQDYSLLKQAMGRGLTVPDNPILIKTLSLLFTPANPVKTPTTPSVILAICKISQIETTLPPNYNW